MSDPHDFDAWHTDERGTDAGSHRRGEVEEVNAKDHDLWGFADRSRRDDASADRRYDADSGYVAYDERAPHARGAAPARRRSGRPEWFAPVLVMALALFAFAGAWLLTRGGSTPTATPPVSAPATVAASSPTSDSQAPQATSTSDAPSSATSAPSSESASSAPGSSNSSASSDSSSSSSSSSSDTATAAAPADAVDTCGDGQPLGDGGVRLAAGTHSSCAYIADAVSQVRSHVAQDANATSFSISPYSTVLKRTIPLSCTRSQHLTQCTGGTNVNFWVTG